MAEPSAPPPTSASGMPLLGGAHLLGVTAVPLPAAAAPLAGPGLAGADPAGLLSLVRTRIPGALGDVEPAPGLRPLPKPADAFEGPAFSYARKRNGSPLPAPPEADGHALRPLTPEQAVRSDPSEPLPMHHQVSFAPLLGMGLGEVRLHTGPGAAATADAMGAAAFTVGRDVFFAEGRYDPVNPAGRALLAHELTHVRQQMAARPHFQGFGIGDDREEQEAEAVERAVMLGLGAPSGGLEVRQLTRRYVAAGNERLPSTVGMRLDELSLQALARAEELLGSAIVGPQRDLGSVQVNLVVRPDGMTDDEIVAGWAQAIASAVRSALG